MYGGYCYNVNNHMYLHVDKMATVWDVSSITRCVDILREKHTHVMKTERKNQ